MASGGTTWWKHPRAPLVAQLAANLVPLLGVLVAGWDLGHVMLLFWAENAVLGLYQVAKLGADTVRGALFFFVHYGLFTLVHGVFVVRIFVQTPTFTETAPNTVHVEGDGPWIPTLLGVTPAIGALFASHGLATVRSFRARRDGAGEDPKLGTVLLYARIVALHVALLATGFIVLRAGSPLWALVILLGIKTVADAGGHFAMPRIQERMAR